jgi:hypothetical protein
LQDPLVFLTDVGPFHVHAGVGPVKATIKQKQGNPFFLKMYNLSMLLTGVELLRVV